MTTIAAIVCAHTLDRWDDIARAMDSLDSQARQADQLILSIDNNVDLYEQASATFGSRVTVVLNTGTRGVSATRNVAAESTDADVLAYLDDDAVADVGWLKALEPWYDDPEIVGVGGIAHPMWAGGKRPSWFPPSFDWVVGCSHSGVAQTPGPIRNFIGCNMSVRRTAWQAVGGFSEDIGRVGANGGGGDETDFCMRVTERVGGTIFHEPTALVSHSVPTSRQSVRYFMKRCYAEGKSKARIAERSTDGLQDEQAHLRSTLPREFTAGILLRGSSWPEGWLRSGAIVLGLGATVAGYVRPHRSSAVEAEMPSFRPSKVVTIDVDDERSSAAEESGVFAVVRSGSQILGVAYDPSKADLEAFGAGVTQRSDVAASSTVAVVIATRDRAESLKRTLDTLLDSTRRPDQIVVVDSAPSNDESEHLVAAWGETVGTSVTYVRSGPGLAVAHNAALPFVETDLVALTDDDVLIDRYWLEEISRSFAEHPGAACVTGGIMPAELETWPQQWAEDSSRFNKGFDSVVFDQSSDLPLFPFAAGVMGSGANMSFRTDWLRQAGGFRATLGAGSTAMGGDDLRAFYDVIASGHSLVFQPNALVFHHHHRTPEAIERQSFGYGVGLTAFLASVVHDNPASLAKMARLAPGAIRHALAVSKPEGSQNFPGQKRRTRLNRRGMLSGPWRYFRSVRAQSSKEQP